MKDKLTFPVFTHDSICGYCNDKALYAQYKNDKKSKYIGTKQIWQELSELQKKLDIAVDALNAVTATPLNSRVIHDVANNALEQITALEQKDVK